MWNKLKSAKLSLIVCWVAIVLFEACLIGLPMIFNLYFINYRGLTPVIVTLRFRIVMLTSMYIGVLLAICALYGLIKLLHMLAVTDNVQILRSKSLDRDLLLRTVASVDLEVFCLQLLG